MAMNDLQDLLKIMQDKKVFLIAPHGGSLSEADGGLYQSILNQTQPREAPTGGEEMANIEKEYLGSAGADKYFYLAKKTGGGGGIEDLLILDAEDKELASASALNVDPQNVKEFVKYAVKKLDITMLSFDIVEKYFFTPEQKGEVKHEAPDKDRKGPDQTGAEHSDKVSGKGMSGMPGGAEEAQPGQAGVGAKESRVIECKITEALSEEAREWALGNLRDWLETFQDEEDDTTGLEGLIKKLESKAPMTVDDYEEVIFHLWQKYYDIDSASEGKVTEGWEGTRLSDPGTLDYYGEVIGKQHRDGSYTVKKANGKTENLTTDELEFFAVEDGPGDIDEAKPPFEEWMKQVDKEIEAVAGMSSGDLPDFMYRDSYDAGKSAKAVARAAVRAAKEDMGEHACGAKHRIIKEAGKYATCEYCGKEMSPDNAGCWGYYKDKAGKYWKRIEYGGKGEDTSMPCGDCNVRAGGYHHAGCDNEECAKCQGQALGCACDFTNVMPALPPAVTPVNENVFKPGDKVVIQPGSPISARFAGIGEVVKVEPLPNVSGGYEVTVKDRDGELVKTHDNFIKLSSTNEDYQSDLEREQAGLKFQIGDIVYYKGKKWEIADHLKGTYALWSPGDHKEELEGWIPADQLAKTNEGKLDVKIDSMMKDVRKLQVQVHKEKDPTKKAELEKELRELSNEINGLEKENEAKGEVKCRYCGRPSEDKSGVCDACTKKYEKESKVTESEIRKGTKVTFGGKPGTIIDTMVDKGSGKAIKMARIHYDDGKVAWEAADDVKMKVAESVHECATVFDNMNRRIGEVTEKDGTFCFAGNEAMKLGQESAKSFGELECMLRGRGFRIVQEARGTDGTINEAGSGNKVKDFKAGDYGLMSIFSTKELVLVRVLPWPSDQDTISGEDRKIKTGMKSEQDSSAPVQVSFGLPPVKRANSLYVEAVDKHGMGGEFQDKYYGKGTRHFVNPDNVYKNVSQLEKGYSYLYPEVLKKGIEDLRKGPLGKLLGEFGLDEIVSTASADGVKYEPTGQPADVKHAQKVGDKSKMHHKMHDPHTVTEEQPLGKGEEYYDPRNVDDEVTKAGPEFKDYVLKVHKVPWHVLSDETLKSALDDFNKIMPAVKRYKATEAKEELQNPNSAPQKIFKKLIHDEIMQIKKDLGSDDALGMDQYAFHPGEDNKVYVDATLFDVLKGEAEYGFGQAFKTKLDDELHKAGYYLEYDGAGVWTFANEGKQAVADPFIAYKTAGAEKHPVFDDKKGVRHGDNEVVEGENDLKGQTGAGTVAGTPSKTYYTVTPIPGSPNWEVMKHWFDPDGKKNDVLKSDLKSKEDAIRYAINAGAKEEDVMVNEGMDVRVEITPAGTIADLDKRDDLTLMTGDSDVQAIKDYFGGGDVDDFDGFFVKTETGDYSEVYGFHGTVPALSKEAYKIEQIMTPSKPETPTWEGRVNEHGINYDDIVIVGVGEHQGKKGRVVDFSSNNQSARVEIDGKMITVGLPNLKKVTSDGTASEAKFGSVEWQDEQIAAIKGKLEQGEELSKSDIAFIEIQLQHNKRAEIEELERMWKASEAKKGAAQ